MERTESMENIIIVIANVAVSENNRNLIEQEMSVRNHNAKGDNNCLKIQMGSD